MADTGVLSTMINLTWSLWTQTSLTKLHFIPHWIHKITIHIIRSYSSLLSTILDRIPVLDKILIKKKRKKEGERERESWEPFKKPTIRLISFAINCSQNSIIFSFFFLWSGDAGQEQLGQYQTWLWACGAMGGDAAEWPGWVSGIFHPSDNYK